MKQRNYDGEVRRESLPSGRGCGEQRVRENYRRTVEAYRARSHRANTALFVVIDADMGDVGDRTRQLREALEQPREANEAILHFIPRRHIETWILHLKGEDVDEFSDYHNRDVDKLIPSAAAKFHDWVAQPPTECLASLRAAIEEAGRLV